MYHVHKQAAHRSLRAPCCGYSEVFYEPTSSTSLSLSLSLSYMSYTGATPTLLALKRMKGKDGKPLNIIQTIAAGDYTTFGMILLQDDNCIIVDLLKKNHRQDGAEGITHAILQKWLQDGSTSTYQHLIQCLRESELGALADAIARTTTRGGEPA